MNYIRKVYSSSSELKVQTNDNKNGDSEKCENEFEEECEKDCENECEKEGEQENGNAFVDEPENVGHEVSSELPKLLEDGQPDQGFRSRAFQKLRAASLMKQISTTIKSARQVVNVSSNESEQHRDNPNPEVESNTNTNNNNSGNFLNRSPKVLRSLDLFNKRMTELQQCLPEGLFSTFSDPAGLEDDPIISEALKLI